MNGLRRVVNNTLISLMGQAVTWASTIVLTIAYGRFLGDERSGELYFAISFVALIGFPLEYGFNQQLVRDVAQAPQRALSYLSNALALKAALWVFLFFVLCGLAWLLGYGADERALVAICGLTLLSAAIGSTFGAVYAAYQQNICPTLGNILEKCSSAAVGFMLLRYLHASVLAVALVLLGGSVLNAAYLAICLLRRLGLRMRLDRGVAAGLIRTAIPFLISGMLGVIYYRIDTVLLSLMLSMRAVGWYGASYRLFDALLFVPYLVVTGVMSPVFSNLSVNSRDTLKLAVEKTTNLMLLCALPLTTGLIVAAPNIIYFLYPRAEFANAIPVLMALAPGLSFLYLNTVVGAILVNTNREKKITVMSAWALVFNLSLNVLLIPRVQQTGAALVTSGTELLLLGLGIAFVPRDLLPVGSIRVALKTLAACAIVALVIRYFGALPIFTLVPLAAVTYVAALALLGAVPRDDIRALLAAVGRKAGGGSRAAPAGRSGDPGPLAPAPTPIDRDVAAAPEAGRQLVPGGDLALVVPAGDLRMPQREGEERW